MEIKAPGEVGAKYHLPRSLLFCSERHHAQWMRQVLGAVSPQHSWGVFEKDLLRAGVLEDAIAKALQGVPDDDCPP